VATIVDPGTAGGLATGDFTQADISTAGASKAFFAHVVVATVNAGQLIVANRVRVWLFFYPEFVSKGAIVSSKPTNKPGA